MATSAPTIWDDPTSAKKLPADPLDVVMVQDPKPVPWEEPFTHPV